MTTSDEQNLGELGLPRANSNALFLFAIVVLVVFGTMAYSCTDKRERQTTDLSSPPQPLSESEWFAGKARGLEPPKPPPIPEITPPPKRPIRTARVSSKPPQKRLGGQVFGEISTTLETVEPSLPPGQQVVSFDSKAGHSSDVRFRPEYYLSRNVEPPLSDFEIKAGTSIPAQLDVGINSDLGGPAIAHITRQVYDTVSGRFAMIPPGTKLYGNVNPRVSFGQTRVDVLWERLIFPNGATLVVENMRASDRSGQLGLHHTVDNHVDRLFSGAVLLSGISAGIQLSQPQERNSFGSAPAIGQTLAASLGQNLGQVSTELIRQRMNVKPTIIIPNGERFTVTVNKDMVFPGPYGTWGY